MTTSPLVHDYLDTLRSTAAGRLGQTRSDELVDEIREHIDAAIAAGQTPAEVLDRLGSPSEIIGAEAPPVRPDPGKRLRVQEVAAISLLLVGLPLLLIGWFVGVALLWTSDRWSGRDKLIGTLLWPGGLGLLLVVGGTVTTSGTSVQECSSSGGCNDVVVASSGPSPWVGILVALVLAAVPVWTAVHLARSAKVPPA